MAEGMEASAGGPAFPGALGFPGRNLVVRTLWVHLESGMGTSALSI